MRTLRWIGLWLAVMTTMLALSAAADVSAKERKEAFAWFDTFGYPDLTHLPLVKVTHESDDPFAAFSSSPAPSSDYGFLIQRDEKKISVFLFNMEKREFPIQPRKAGEKGTTLETVDLQSYVARLSKAFDLWEKGDGSLMERDHASTFGLFLLARVCEGRGLEAETAKLCAMTARFMAVYGSDGRRLDTLRDHLADEMESSAHGRLWRDFEDSAVPRTALLTECRDMLRHFPHGGHEAFTKDMEKVLTRMVAEDREHAARPPVPAGQVSQQQQIADLIFALRDQNGHQWINPGECDVFNDARGEQSPAGQLRKIGFPAVPALLEALTDSRPTRSCGAFHQLSGILSVGAVAQQILEALAYRHFYHAADFKGSVTREQYIAGVRKEARQWWAEVQARGEKQVLIEGVRGGGAYAGEQARRLAVLDPSAVPPAVREGIKRAHEDYNRQELVSILAELHRPADLPLLKMHMLHGKDLGTRLEAAKALYEQGDREVLTCMIQEWGRRPELAAKDSFFIQNAVTELIRFLADCGAPQGMQALEQGLQERGEGIRFEVVEVLFEGGDYAEPREPAQSPPKRTKAQEECAAAAQHLLVGLLEDKAALRGASLGGGNSSFQDPRLCDFANGALAYLWPHTFAYHESGSRFERDHECITMANRWRSAHGLMLLPLPTRPQIPPVAASRIQPLLQQFTQPGSAQERAQVGDRIVAIGLPALAAVHTFRQTAAKEVPTEEWNRLEQRLGGTVRTVRIEDGGVKLRPEVIQRLTALEEQTLTAQTCISWILEILYTLPADAEGMRFTVLRDNDGAGFTIALTLFPVHESKPHTRGLATYEGLRVGTETVTSGSGSAESSKAINADNLMDLSRGMEKALAGDPYQPICLEVVYRHNFQAN